MCKKILKKIKNVWKKKCVGKKMVFHSQMKHQTGAIPTSFIAFSEIVLTRNSPSQIIRKISTHKIKSSLVRKDWERVRGQKIESFCAGEFKKYFKKVGRDKIFAVVTPNYFYIFLQQRYNK
jgi:hypothetical protein